MGRANVYLPDELERRVKAAGIAVSEVCQRALLAAVEAVEASGQHLPSDLRIQFQRGWDAGVKWAAAAPIEPLLTVLRDQRIDEIPAEALPSDLYTFTRQPTLAWEAGFVEAARTSIRAWLPAEVPLRPTDPSGVAAKKDAEDAESVDRDVPAHPPSESARTSAQSESVSLGDDSGCHIGVTVDGGRVSFDPHSAVRAGKSPLFAVLGQADLRARLMLSLAQDAAARGAGVVLVDLAGSVTPQATGLGTKVRVIGRPHTGAGPQFEHLRRGAIGLGGLWETIAGLAASSGLAEMLGPPDDGILEPGYVSVLNLGGDGALGAALAVGQAAHVLARSATSVGFPRLLLIDLPVGLSIPGALGSRLGQIIRTAREHDVALGLSAESAEPVMRVGGGGALLSTVFAFATSNPMEANALRDLLGADAPILLNPPGLTTAPSDEVWAVMRDLEGRLGQVRLDG